MMQQPSSRQDRRRGARVVATSTALALAAGAAMVTLGAAPASAASVRAQAVGRFVDGAVGGMPIQSVADLKDARAATPGTATAQNPLDVTLGGQATIPLSGKLQAPGDNVFHAGVAEQIARARANGYSLGAAGAVANQGGASLGGGSAPADASITLSPAALPSSPVPLPGGSSPDALGGLTLHVGAVSAKAYTNPGFRGDGGTNYQIGGLTLTLGSPALGQLFQQLTKALTPPALPAPLPDLFPKACQLSTQLLSKATIGGGALTIDPADGSITLDVAAVLRTLGANLNGLPANTDLLGYVLDYLTSAKGLSAGVQAVIGDTLTTQKANFENCLSALPAPVGALVKTFVAQLTAGQDQLTMLINGIVQQVTSAGGSNPLAPVTDGLKQALSIGANVQPHGPRGSYSSPLSASPDQATPAVAGQIVERALEIDLGGGSGVNLALANAAAGPGTPAVAPVTVAPQPTAPVKHNAVLPTAIPAGKGPISSTGDELPLFLVAAGLVLAVAGTMVWRRSARSH